MIDSKENIDRVDERTLARAWAAQLSRLLQMRICRVADAFKDPSAATMHGVFTLEPRTDLMVEHFGVTAVTYAEQDSFKLADDTREADEIDCYTAKCEGVAYESFVHGRSH